VLKGRVLVVKSERSQQQGKVISERVLLHLKRVFISMIPQDEVGAEDPVLEETYDARKRRKRAEAIELRLAKASKRPTDTPKRLVLLFSTYPVTSLCLILVAYFIISWASFALHATFHMLIKVVEPSPLVEKNVCKSVPLMMSVQRKQLEKAREELGDELAPEKIPSHLKSTVRDYDFGFYTYNLGTLDVEITDQPRTLLIPHSGRGRSKGGFTSLVYYRIYKAANDHIRGMLLKFAHLTGLYETDFRTCKSVEECIHSGAQYKPAGASKTLFFPNALRRYPFTFVRDPLARVIAGYREIDYRVMAFERTQWLALNSPIGTAERFKEFIRLILLHNGSQKLLRYPGAEVAHVAPFIGTLHQAVKKEPYSLRVFRVETLESDWVRLSDETAQPRLWDAWTNKQLWPHLSAVDPYNSSTTAWDFLQPALNMTMAHFLDLKKLYAELTLQLSESLDGDASSSLEMPLAERSLKDPKAIPSVPKSAAVKPTPAEKARARSRLSDRMEKVRGDLIAALYLRAICRIYVSDFICGGYEMPPICNDLHDEVAADGVAHEKIDRRRAWRKTVVERLAPNWLLYIFAEIPCMIFSNSPPECIGRFVHGDEVFDEDSEEVEWNRSEL